LGAGKRFIRGQDLGVTRFILVQSALNLSLAFLIQLIRHTGVKQVGQLNSLVGFQRREERIRLLF